MKFGEILKQRYLSKSQLGMTFQSHGTNLELASTESQDDPQPSYSPSSGNTFTKPEPVPKQDHPDSHLEPVLIQNLHRTQSELVSYQNLDSPQSGPGQRSTSGPTLSIPVPIQDHPDPQPEPVLIQHQSGSHSSHQVVLNQNHMIFKDLNNKNKKDKINKNSSDPIHSLPEELQMTINEDPMLEQRLDQIMIAYHKSVSHPSYTLPFFLFKLKQCVHYHHDPERFASYLYKSLLNEWNKPQTPIRTQPSSPLPRTRPHDVPEWVWQQQHEPRKPVQEISPEDRAYAEYLLWALGEI